MLSKAQIPNTINLMQHTSFNFTDSPKPHQTQTSKVKLQINLQHC